MDLSSNALRGEIPQEIADLVGLKYLNLSNKKFGVIQSGVQNLQALETLGLPRNILSGPIPPTISSFVSHYNVSFNNLSGPILTGGQFGTFTDPTTYLPGNPELCGEAINRPCGGGQTNPLPDPPLGRGPGTSAYSFSLSIEGLGIGAASGFLILVVATLAWAPARVSVFGAAEGQARSAICILWLIQVQVLEAYTRVYPLIIDESTEVILHHVVVAHDEVGSLV